MNGACTDDSDICHGYFCLNGEIVNAEGRECYTTHNISSPNCTGGTFCNEFSNTCHRSTAEPKVIYNPVDHEGCYTDFDCDLGLYCAPYRNSVDGKGKCFSCLKDDGCPEQGIPSFPTCKYSEYECPKKCVKLDGKCWTTDPKMGKRCRGTKCNEKGYCVNDNCKKAGTCTNDDDICPEYGCLQGKVVYVAGQKCNTKGGEKILVVLMGLYAVMIYSNATTNVLHSIQSNTETFYAITRPQMALVFK